MKKSLGIAPIEFFLRMPKKAADLEMYLSSSSVNQLSTLYLYFKYWAESENNFLMIDEQEENLHPQHQLTLLKILYIWQVLDKFAIFVEKVKGRPDRSERPVR